MIDQRNHSLLLRRGCTPRLGTCLTLQHVEVRGLNHNYHWIVQIVDDAFTNKLRCNLPAARSACVGHVHMTKISIWCVYTNSNGDSLNIIRQENH